MPSPSWRCAKKIHLPLSAYKDLKENTRIKKAFYFYPHRFDAPSIDTLEDLKLPIYKIPSGEVTNLPYLRKIGKTAQKSDFINGMATLKEIGVALNVLANAGTKKENITVLHCNTEYPTPFEDVNLRAMLTIRDTLKIKVGYSDHSFRY